MHAKRAKGVRLRGAAEAAAALGALAALSACGSGGAGAGLGLQLAGLLGMVGLLALAAGAAALRGRKRSDGPEATLRVRASCGLGARQRVVAVEAGDRVLILAQGPRRCDLLTEMPREAWRRAATTETGRRAFDARIAD